MNAACALKDVAGATVGFVGKMTPHYRNEGVTFLRSQDIRPHRIDVASALKVDPEFEARIRKSRLRAGDVVVVRTGKPGTSAVVPPELEGANCSDLVVIRPGPELSSEWLSYYINAAAQGFVRERLVGAVQQHFNVKSALEMPVPVLSLSVQEAQARVLGALDDKIAANGALVSAAETLRRTAWVRATRGAELAPLSSFAQFVNGGAYTKGATGTGRVVIRIAELNSGISASTVYNDLEVPDRQVAHAGDLLMSWSGSLTAVRWYRDDAIVNQHIFKVIPRDDHPLWAVACAVETKLDEFREIAAGKATTMGHIKRADLDSPVAWPEISDRLNDAGSALWERALAAEQENLCLAATRDELLPLLMSGKIAVKDAEKAVEEVV